MPEAHYPDERAPPAFERLVSKEISNGVKSPTRDQRGGDIILTNNIYNLMAKVNRYNAGKSGRAQFEGEDK